MAGSRSVRERLETAVSDRHSGATAIALSAAAALEDLAGEMTGARLRTAALGWARRLVEAHAVMAPLRHLESTVGRSLQALDPVAALAQAAREFRVRLVEEQDSVAQFGAGLLGKDRRILVFSASSTMRACLVKACPQRVLCAASEPGGEGRTMAKVLARDGIEAVVFPDTGVRVAVGQADAVLLGCDALGPGSFMNKLGTLTVAHAALAAGVSCYLLAGRSKLLGAETYAGLRSPEAPARAGSLSVPIFEATPLKGLTAVAMDDGPVAPETAGRRAARLELTEYH
ncbi:MAG: hypothetical protein WDA71_02820 [Actinomycetota bacterium]